MKHYIGGVEKTKKEVEEWKKEMKRKRIEGEKKVKELAEKVKRQWPKEEWFKMMDKLEILSLEELRDLTTKVGINFTIGNENIENKQEFILVLDEAEKDELIEEYNKIIKKKGGEKIKH